MSQLKADLAGPAPTPIKALLIDQVTVCWMASMHAEIEAAGPNGSLEQARFRQARAESSQRRPLLTMKALATLRPLLGLRLCEAPATQNW